MFADHTGRPGTDEEFRQLAGRLLIAAFAFVAVVLVGVLGYRWLVPGTSWLDALYMAIITLTTVGYGEIVEPSATMRIFTILLLITGLGVAAYFVTTATGLIIEGYVGHVFWRRRMERQVERLAGHYIVCGGGETALHAVEELVAVRHGVVVVADADETDVGQLRDRLGQIPLIVGDPADDRILEAAGLSRARGVLACAENDKDNLVITLTARQANPALRVISQATRPGMEAKLRRAGADAVVSSSLIGGLRMASELIRPTVVSFLDRMLRDTDRNLRVGEVAIDSGSPVLGLSVQEADPLRGTNALLLALEYGDEWTYNPSRETVLDAGMTLILMGSPEEIEEVERNLSTAPTHA